MYVSATVSFSNKKKVSNKKRLFGQDEKGIRKKTATGEGRSCTYGCSKWGKILLRQLGTQREYRQTHEPAIVPFEWLESAQNSHVSVAAVSASVSGVRDLPSVPPWRGQCSWSDSAVLARTPAKRRTHFLSIKSISACHVSGVLEPRDGTAAP